MINFKDYLNDGVNDYFLYHGSPSPFLEEILNSNTLYGNTMPSEMDIGKIRTKHKNIVKYQGGVPNDYYKGVSLSRNYNFSKSYGNKNGNKSVVFVLDSRKLKTRFKIVPYDFLAGEGRSNQISEFEEFVLGDIKPLDRYLISIFVARKDIENLKYDFPHFAHLFKVLK